MKHEEQLKEKLEQRTIQPSSNAWQKLNDKLDEEAPTNNKKGFWYIGIAASIVGILLITNVFFSNDNANIVEPVIVDTKTSVDTQNTNDVNEAKKELINNKTEDVSTNNTKTDAVEKKEPTKQSVLKQKIDSEQLKLIPNKTEKKIVAENINKEEKEATTKKLSFEEQKAKDVVAQIQTLKKTKEVTDAEIDALLSAAQREISFKRLYNESTKTIDANALLLSVEDDIEQESFRTRVFEMLKAGYNEVKTVVAERNN